MKNTARERTQAPLRAEAIRRIGGEFRKKHKEEKWKKKKKKKRKKEKVKHRKRIWWKKCKESSASLFTLRRKMDVK